MSKAVEVPTALYWSSRLFAATAPLWRRLADLETAVLREEIDALRVDRPIYVTSLARAGTTIVTEMLERHPALTSHRYSDFPNVWTPYWRNHLLQRTRREQPQPTERAHRDRIRVSNDSPEAVEEVLWAHFFDQLHDEERKQPLDAGTRHPEFERFYDEHIRKLLRVRGAQRYLAKGNYNITRLPYLLRLFPGARFVVPLREPVHHIASLSKQHRLFLESARTDPRVPRQLALSGHYEFGPQRRFVHLGDDDLAARLRRCVEEGREVEAWARYWAAIYGYLADRLSESSELREATFLFRYEELCDRSETVIDALLAHCGLEAEPFAEHRRHYATALSLPDYYQPDFSREELALIEEHCAPVRARLASFLREL